MNLILLSIFDNIFNSSMVLNDKSLYMKMYSVWCRKNIFINVKAYYIKPGIEMMNIEWEREMTSN
jgi:hypothetical protein